MYQGVEGVKEMSFGGDDVKTGGKCIIIIVDQGSRGDSKNRGRDGGSQGGEE